MKGNTSLGVSNVSFGLPCRDAVNSTFFALALGRGLSAAIMNPYSTDMMKTYYSYRALAALDENCADFKRLCKSKKLLKRNSRRHKLYILLSDFIISSHAENEIFSPFGGRTCRSW